MLHRVRVEPIRLSYHDVSLSVRVLHGVGYRYRCECGERGSRRGDWISARLDAIKHRQENPPDSHG